MSKLFGKLQEIYDKESVSEIIIDSYEDIYWADGSKIEEGTTLLKSEQEVYEMIESLLASVGRDIKSIKDGFADIRLSDGTRVTITMPLISLNGPALLIRKLPQQKVSVENLISWGTFNEQGWKVCEKLMRSGKNILLAGNAGSGKTTILNTLIQAIEPESRVVTVEKTAEINTYNRKRTLRLETPTAQRSEMKELVQKAGLLRGDTIVINEVGGTEAFDVINLMREGFSVLATVMAEGVHDCLRKFELLCMMDQSNLGSKEITYHVATGVDAVIFQERLAGGKRVMSHIALVEGLDDLERFITVPLFTYDEQTGEFFLTPKGKAFLEQ